MNTNIEFKPGQCAVYTEADGTTRSVMIHGVNKTFVTILWRAGHTTFRHVDLLHAAARKCLVLFPEGEKFMVLEGGAK